MSDPEVRARVCGYDACSQPGFCDGRHCLEAGGRIRTTPEEDEADRAARALGAALALLRPSERLDTGTSHRVDVAAGRDAVALIEARLRSAGIAFIDPE